MTRRASTLALLALAPALALLTTAGQAAAQKAGATPILTGPLAKLDIKPAQIDTARGKPKGTLTIAMHFALDPGWLDPLEHSYVITMQMYDYLVHDAMIKPMPQGEVTYSLAEHAELTADFRQAAFRLRPGLKFHDGQPLTTRRRQVDLRELQGRLREDLPRQARAHPDRRTTARSSSTSRSRSSTSWTSTTAGSAASAGSCPSTITRRSAATGSRRKPIGAGPYKLVSQQAGVQMDVRGVGGVLAPHAGDQDDRRQGRHGILPARLAGLQTGELDLAYGMTGKLLPRVMADKNLRWDPELHGPVVAHVPRLQRARAVRSTTSACVRR